MLRILYRTVAVVDRCLQTFVGLGCAEDGCWSVDSSTGPAEAGVAELLDGWLTFSPMTLASHETPCTAVSPNACMNASSLGSTPSSPSSSPSSSLDCELPPLDGSDGKSTALRNARYRGIRQLHNITIGLAVFSVFSVHCQYRYTSI